VNFHELYDKKHSYQPIDYEKWVEDNQKKAILREKRFEQILAEKYINMKNLKKISW